MLQLMIFNVLAMEIFTPNRLEITWEEVVQIGKRLYDEHGEKVDLHELILQECKPNDIIQQVPTVSTLVRQSSKPKIERRNTHDKIYDGFKSACTTLISIRKISSSPTP
ncbi:MAG: hypothetical protein AMXMBFR12_05230 [Candidatus Babeliales bacterium]